MSKNLFKIVSITMIVVMLFAFVGCDKKPVNNPNEEPTLVEPVSGENNEKKNNEEKTGTTEKVEGTTKKNESTTKPSETTTKKTESTTKKNVSNTQKPAPTTKKAENTTKKIENTTKKPTPTTKKVENTTKKPTPVTQKPAEQTTKKIENTTKKPAEQTTKKNYDFIGDNWDKSRYGMMYDEVGNRIYNLDSIPEGGDYYEYDSYGYCEMKQKPYSPGNEPVYEPWTCPDCGRSDCGRQIMDGNCYDCGKFVKANTCHYCN